MKSFLRLGKTWGYHVMIVLRLSWLLSKAKWVEIVWKVKLVPRGSHSSIAQSSLQASLKMSASDSLWGCVCNGNNRTPEVKECPWMKVQWQKFKKANHSYWIFLQHDEHLQPSEVPVHPRPDHDDNFPWFPLLTAFFSVLVSHKQQTDTEEMNCSRSQ